MKNQTCGVRRATCDVAVATDIAVESLQPTMPTPPPQPLTHNPARRTPHAARRPRRLRVGRDGIFPW
jgi:hypothetical protein